MKQKWKNVSIKDCIGIIIWSLIFLAGVACIPCSLGDEKQMFFNKLIPLNNEVMPNIVSTIITSISNLVTLPSNIVDIVATYIIYVPSAYIAILLADILFSIILMIFREKFLRIIFKIFSIIFGFVMIVCFICSIVFVAGMLIAIVYEQIQVSILESGLISFAVMLIGSFIFMIKQFKWFSNPYKFKFVNRNEFK